MGTPLRAEPAPKTSPALRLVVRPARARDIARLRGLFHSAPEMRQFVGVVPYTLLRTLSLPLFVYMCARGYRPTAVMVFEGDLLLGGVMFTRSARLETACLRRGHRHKRHAYGMLQQAVLELAHRARTDVAFWTMLPAVVQRGRENGFDLTGRIRYVATAALGPFTVSWFADSADVTRSWERPRIPLYEMRLRWAER